MGCTNSTHSNKTSTAALRTKKRKNGKDIKKKKRRQSKSQATSVDPSTATSSGNYSVSPAHTEAEPLPLSADEGLSPRSLNPLEPASSGCGSPDSDTASITSEMGIACKVLSSASIKRSPSQPKMSGGGQTRATDIRTSSSLTSNKSWASSANLEALVSLPAPIICGELQSDEDKELLAAGDCPGIPLLLNFTPEPTLTQWRNLAPFPPSLSRHTRRVVDWIDETGNDPEPVVCLFPREGSGAHLLAELTDAALRQNERMLGNVRAKSTKKLKKYLGAASDAGSRSRTPSHSSHLDCSGESSMSDLLGLEEERRLSELREGSK